MIDWRRCLCRSPQLSFLTMEVLAEPPQKAGPRAQQEEIVFLYVLGQGALFASAQTMQRFIAAECQHGSHSAACQHHALHPRLHISSSTQVSFLLSARECIHFVRSLVLWVGCNVREIVQLAWLTLPQL